MLAAHTAILRAARAALVGVACLGVAGDVVAVRYHGCAILHRQAVPFSNLDQGPMRVTFLRAHSRA